MLSAFSNSFMFPQRQLTVWIKYNGSLWFAQRESQRFFLYHFGRPQEISEWGLVFAKNSPYWWLGLIISWYKRIILSSIKSQSSFYLGYLTLASSVSKNYVFTYSILNEIEDNILQAPELYKCEFLKLATPIYTTENVMPW